MTNPALNSSNSRMAGNRRTAASYRFSESPVKPGPSPTMESSMQLQEVVEAEGHLIDSHVMEDIFDKVVEHNARFEVEQFRIGRTNSEASYLRLKVEAPDQASMEHLLQELLGLGCAPVESGDAALRELERDRCAPEDFYSTTNHRTFVRHGQKWIEVENQRMDAMIVVRDGRAFCRRLRDLRAH